MAQRDTGQHGAPMDYAEHESTYKVFIGLVKWGTVAVVTLLVLMAAFLVR